MLYKLGGIGLITIFLFAILTEQDPAKLLAILIQMPMFQILFIGTVSISIGITIADKFKAKRSRLKD
ncbi:hypothetical protein ACFSCX_05975 [Bacillus salitolerans]|uniref:DUF1049 domain-containing protein n=1 Tax=Bacillus salitolerans TaxID=1437434 RepID=A0ABW4LLQ3_9BACI